MKKSKSESAYQSRKVAYKGQTAGLQALPCLGETPARFRDLTCPRAVLQEDLRLKQVSPSNRQGPRDGTQEPKMSLCNPVVDNMGIVKCINKMGDPGQMGTDEPVRKIHMSCSGPNSSMGQGKQYANWAWRPITLDKKSGGGGPLISLSSEEREKVGGPP